MIIHSNINAIFKTSTIIVIITIASRFFGLLREVIIAGHYGVGDLTDAFFVAFKIPDILFNSLISFLIATSFIPIYSEYLIKGGIDKEWKMVSNYINVLGMILLSIIILLEIFTPIVINILAPGIEGNTLSFAIILSRIMIPIIIFGGLTGLCKSILYAREHYILPTFIPIIYNIIVITCIIFLSKYYGIIALAIGVLIAAIIQFISLVPTIIKQGFTYYPKFDIKDEGLLKISRLMYPVVLALFLGQIVSIFETFLASRLFPGAISYINYAYRLFVMPEQIYTLIISSIIFPYLSLYSADEFKTNVNDKFTWVINLTIITLLPFSFYLMEFSSTIISLIFGRGAFGASAVEGTSNAFLAYVLGLLPVCIRSLLFYTYFAKKDSKTLLIIMLFIAPLNIGFDMVLIKYISFIGLALGSTITTIVHMCVLIMILGKHNIKIDLHKVLKMSLKVLFCSVVMISFVYIIKNIILPYYPIKSLLHKISYLGAYFIISLFIYITTAYLLKIEEIKTIMYTCYKK
jgi:putative peptidoglycan lipid II flippase